MKNNPKLKGPWGGEIASRIAAKRMSGEEKREVRPEVGKEWRQKIMKEMNDQKSRRE